MNIINGLNFGSLLGSAIPIALKLGLLIAVVFIITPIVKSIIGKVVKGAGKNRGITKGRTLTLVKLLQNAFGYFMIFLFLTMSFAILHIPIGPLLASAGIVGLAIGFGAQGVVSDIVTGFFILLEHQIDVDDYITVGSFSGVVEEVGLRTIKIRSSDGTLNFIPNRQITSVSNHSRGNMQALIDLTVNHADDVENTIQTLEDICHTFQHDSRFKEGPNVLGVQSLNTADFVLRIVGQTENGQQQACERDVREQIKNRLYNSRA